MVGQGKQAWGEEGGRGGWLSRIPAALRASLWCHRRGRLSWSRATPVHSPPKLLATVLPNHTAVLVTCPAGPAGHGHLPSVEALFNLNSREGLQGTGVSPVDIKDKSVCGCVCILPPALSPIVSPDCPRRPRSQMSRTLRLAGQTLRNCRVQPLQTESGTGASLTAGRGGGWWMGPRTAPAAFGMALLVLVPAPVPTLRAAFQSVRQGCFLKSKWQHRERSSEDVWQLLLARSPLKAYPFFQSY